MHHVQGSVLTLGGDPFETAAEHSDTVAQKRAVSRIVNVAFHDTGVSAKFTSVRYALLTRQAHHPLINLFGDLRDRKSTRLNSSHQIISYAVFCLKKKKKKDRTHAQHPLL